MQAIRIALQLLMKISIYNEPEGGALGGCEVSVAVLAEALAQEHEVEIVHYRPTLTREFLAEFADVDLSRVSLRLGPVLEPQRGSPWQVIARMRKEMKQEADIGGDCDVFVSFNHQTPVFTKAPLGILMVLFPFSIPGSVAQEEACRAPMSRVKKAWQSRWQVWKFRARLRNYSVRLSNSEFTRTWTKKRWGIDTQVLFPPVEVKSTAAGKKAKRILSVGRFATKGHGKKQIEMLEVFRRLKSKQEEDWSYDCVGACGSSAAEQAFLEQTKTLAEESGAAVTANISRAELKERYGQASIFWHATGMGVSEEMEPEMAEHFGMTTVEAMAAGCVPVVIRKGGQPEIVEHGINGFLWDSLDELERYTMQLQGDPSLLKKMSKAAQARASKFSREVFVTDFKRILPLNKDNGMVD